MGVKVLWITEVLQGFGSERDFNETKRLLTSLLLVELGGQDVAIQAARNFRTLRGRDCSAWPNRLIRNKKKIKARRFRSYDRKYIVSNNQCVM